MNAAQLSRVIWRKKIPANARSEFPVTGSVDNYQPYELYSHEHLLPRFFTKHVQYKADLWKTSVHWCGFFFGPKPMNCPGHYKIFAHRDVSYVQESTYTH